MRKTPGQKCRVVFVIKFWGDTRTAWGEMNKVWVENVSNFTFSKIIYAWESFEFSFQSINLFKYKVRYNYNFRVRQTLPGRGYKKETKPKIIRVIKYIQTCSGFPTHLLIDFFQVRRGPCLDSL